MTTLPDDIDYFTGRTLAIHESLARDGAPSGFRDLLEDSLAHYQRGWKVPTWSSDAFSVLAPIIHRRSGDALETQWIRDICQLCLVTDAVWIPDLVTYFAGLILPRTNEPEDDPDAAHEISVHRPLGRRFETVGVRHPPGSWPPEYVEKMIASVNARGIGEGLVPGAAEPGHDRIVSLLLRTLTEFARTMVELSPLIASGAVRLYPVDQLYLDHVAKPLLGEKRYHTPEELEGAWPKLVVAEGMLMADALRTGYAALSPEELAVLENTPQGRSLHGAEQKVVACVSRGLIPQLNEPTPELVAKIRADDPAFDDFRKMLRKFARELHAHPIDEHFEREAQQIAQDTLLPEIEALSKAMWSNLRPHLGDSVMSFSAGTVANFLHLPSPGTATATSATSTAGRLLWKALFSRGDSRPARRTIVALLRATN